MESNNVIKNHKNKPIIPNYFEKENACIQDNTKIVNSFNDFFVNVGPNLAANIPKIKGDTTDGSLIMENVNSIFLGRVEKEEILNIVKGCANTGSTD